MESVTTHSGDLYAVLGWLEKNRKNLIIGFVAVILAGIAYYYVNWRREQDQIVAGETLSSLYLSAGGSNVASGALLKVAADHTGTEAGARALLGAAGQHYLDGKVEDARATFQRFITEYPESRLLGQAKHGLAVCMEAQGKSADAITAYGEVANRFHDENVMAPAKLALARLYEAEKKLEQARDAYMDIARDNRSNSTLAAEAQARLMELLQKHPDLRPKAPQAPPGGSALMPTPTPVVPQ